MRTELSVLPWIAFLGAISFQVTILVFAAREWLRNCLRGTRKFEVRCELDLKSLAEQGRGPDWNRYHAEADRLFETCTDRIRMFSSGLLAVEFFGLLCFSFGALWLIRVGSQNVGSEIQYYQFGDALKALFCSLFGVFVHSLIALFVLRRAEKQFALWLADSESRLQEYAGNHPVKPLFVSLSGEEMERILKSSTRNLVSAFVEATKDVSGAVSRLDGHVVRLSTGIEDQGKGMNLAVAAIANDVSTMVQASGTFLPIAVRLVTVAESLDKLPIGLSSALEESRDRWLDGLSVVQEERLREIAEAARHAEELAENRERQMITEIHALQLVVGEVRDAVGGIPQALSKEVGRMADRLGTEFGHEARDVTRELAEQLEHTYHRLLQKIEEHEQGFLNRIGTVVDELFSRLSPTS